MRKTFFLKAVTYLCAGIIGAATLYLISLNRVQKPGPPNRLEAPVIPTEHAQPNKVLVHLYFADKNNSFLTSEDRVLFQPDSIAAFGRTIVEELIQGPREGLAPTIPVETALRAFYATQGGIAFVDVTEAVTENHPGGTRSELMTIYSIVNSLVLNIPEIDTVKILIGGREALTLAGHVDLRFPFQADMLLIR